MDDRIGTYAGYARSGFLVLALTLLLAFAVALAVWWWMAGSGDTERGDDHPWALGDRVTAAVNRGVAHMEQYDYANAAKAFEEARARAPSESVDLTINLGIAILNRNGKGDIERADALFVEALEANPDHPRALYMRGIVHQYAGRDEEALPFFRRVTEIAPNDAYAWYFLGRSLLHLERPARAAFERAMAENPALISAYHMLLRVAAEEGAEEEADRLEAQFLKLRESPLSEAVVAPEYHRMGPLALARPLAKRPGTAVAGELRAGEPRAVLADARSPDRPIPRDGHLALADVNGDGHLDAVGVRRVDDESRLGLLLGAPGPVFRDATADAGLAQVERPFSCSFGDYDNDDVVDLFVCCEGPDRLLRGRGDGTFEDVTERAGVGGDGSASVSAVFLDADHDGDLDIYVCGAGANRLWNNNADGTFVDIAAPGGLACDDGFVSQRLAPADIDGDRDTDLIVFQAEGPVRVFVNERLGRYTEASGWLPDDVIAPRGGVAQDFNGDGRPDVLVFPGAEAPARLYLSDATGRLAASAQFDGVAASARSHGPPRSVRVGDYDLDGDLDAVFFSGEGHFLRNDGWGRFALQPGLWPLPADGKPARATELVDLNGDGVADLLRTTWARGRPLEIVPGVLEPPARWIAVQPTGHRGKDGRTRSPASGYGVRMELRAGLHASHAIYTGLDGGFGQSHRPWFFGLDGAKRADYLALLWTDGVTQAELGMAPDAVHRVMEMERKVSSCPVLFTWDGERFAFVTDFAGVGGLGYFVAPGEYAPPQVREHVKIDASQLRPREGRYELRFAEPMEEVAYLDRVELVAVDHPRGVEVHPDERLVLGGPEPSQRLLAVDAPIYPAKAHGPDGADRAANLRAVDRRYAYAPPIDRRFIGFCEEHSLTLDFGDRLRALPADRPVHLYLNASIEYPYSQTTYAASQAQVSWEAPRLERRKRDGTWETLVADIGAPGGTARTICVDLGGKLRPEDRVLRIRTNLELYYDRVFVAADRGLDGITRRTVPLVAADLRRLGFPTEHSPDGQHPTIYDYGRIEPSSTFKLPRGRYTRYGDVAALLGEFDDRYVVFGTGDEIAASFDAEALPPIPEGCDRSFVLISHGYCKDMDLYTATPDTVKPLPFRAMSRYPYPEAETYPTDAACRAYLARYNTRSVR
jgi:hypothetical protein